MKYLYHPHLLQADITKMNAASITRGIVMRRTQSRTRNNAKAIAHIADKDTVATPTYQAPVNGSTIATSNVAPATIANFPSLP